MMHAIFSEEDSGTARMVAFSRVEYSSNSETESVIETTEEELASVFENAKANGATLDGAETSIDDDYVRETDET